MHISSEHLVSSTIKPHSNEKNRFLEDVLAGLRSTPKQLQSKYFYDKTGDTLFQKIMDAEEYYVTRCEAEIFQTHGHAIAAALKTDNQGLNLIELGAGDASKTIYLLRELRRLECDFHYVPIDISSSIIQYLEHELPTTIPGLTVNGLNGEYLEMLLKASKISARRNAVLFLGSNIGNMNTVEALEFLRKIRLCLNKGDKLLIGFDLKKDPAVVLNAYNDASGFTRAFNLNLLSRINRELDGGFDINQFSHFPTYDPISGECKSFLVSKQDQEVYISGEVFSFKKGEVIYMELSQKYDFKQIQELAHMSGFKTSFAFKDSKNWFVDVVWECV